MRFLLALLFLWTPASGETNSAFQWIQKVGSGRDSYAGLAADPAGNIYVVGNTRSPDFPVKSPLQPTLASPDSSDIFIVKLDPAGNVVFATCFGGTAEDAASAMTVDPLGNVYATGLTRSGNVEHLLCGHVWPRGGDYGDFRGTRETAGAQVIICQATAIRP